MVRHWLFALSIVGAPVFAASADIRASLEIPEEEVLVVTPPQIGVSRPQSLSGMDETTPNADVTNSANSSSSSSNSDLISSVWSSRLTDDERLQLVPAPIGEEETIVSPPLNAQNEHPEPISPPEERVVEAVEPAPNAGFPVRLNLSMAAPYSFDDLWLAMTHNPARATFVRAHGPWVIRGFVETDGLGGRCVAETALRDNRSFAVVSEMTAGILNWTRNIGFVVSGERTGETNFVQASISFDRNRPFSLRAEKSNGLISIPVPGRMEGQVEQFFRTGNTMHILVQGTSVVSIPLQRSMNIPEIMDDCMADTQRKTDHIKGVLQYMRDNG